MAAGLEQSEHPQVQKAINLCSSYAHPIHKTICKSRVSSAFGELWKKDDISEDDAVSANTTGIITITLDALSEVNASVSFAGSDGTALITEDYLVDGISATINAGTLTTTFNGPFNLGGNVTVQNLGYVSPGRKITTVSVEVETALAGGLDSPVIEVGTASNVDLFMGTLDSDLSLVDDFIILPEYVYPDTANVELLVQAKLTHFAATAGSVTVKVTYL